MIICTWWSFKDLVIIICKWSFNDIVIMIWTWWSFKDLVIMIYKCWSFNDLVMMICKWWSFNNHDIMIFTRWCSDDGGELIAFLSPSPPLSRWGHKKKMLHSLDLRQNVESTKNHASLIEKNQNRRNKSKSAYCFSYFTTVKRG